ncbi:hypothetical protein [Chryseobacterium echinoideorum]|uniref:hypothetical protein n=1 Tax=Chryseobacterium echinoideorum TaxID=1549648 RepID=UPI0011861942|nr:hypothetical protein [Chryseobacterium echinoideorum]
MKYENIQFGNPEQIINMGGPWVGDLIINNQNVSNNILIDNYLEKELFYYFIKYFKISKKQKDNFFSVLRIDKNNMKVAVSIEKFEKIHIKDIEENSLYYYEGFHENLPVKNSQVNFN